MLLDLSVGRMGAGKDVTDRPYASVLYLRSPLPGRMGRSAKNPGGTRYPELPATENTIADKAIRRDSALGRLFHEIS